MKGNNTFHESYNDHVLLLAKTKLMMLLDTLGCIVPFWLKKKYNDLKCV